MKQSDPWLIRPGDLVSTEDDITGQPIWQMVSRIHDDFIWAARYHRQRAKIYRASLTAWSPTEDSDDGDWIE